jgi:hypothetical protein
MWRIRTGHRAEAILIAGTGNKLAQNLPNRCQDSFLGGHAAPAFLRVDQLS